MKTKDDEKEKNKVLAQLQKLIKETYRLEAEYAKLKQTNYENTRK